MNTQTHCIRCGECCIQSSPTLQAKDLHFVEEGAIARQDLYTIRRGELVWDNVIEALVVTREEMIKIREKEEGGCIYYDAADKACKIYEERPAQCSAMACWEPARFMKVYREPKLARKDTIKDPILADLIETHESRCSYEAMEWHVKRIEMEGDKAVEAIIEILRFDNRVRPYISQKLNLDLKEMDFIFGRAMIDTVVMFGLKVEKTPDGSFYLTTLHGKTGTKR
jgi:Fe-S-cluster containining protein